ncbi:MAG: DJ-1/PfpI family protein [Pseudomonadales bacterium]|jgi:cyclohexyl-isocyanide hydratase|nr:DJ-1/PfpI family protein [Pseudomonadales bacterium]
MSLHYPDLIPPKDAMQISMLIYPNFTALDLFGPLQIWTMLPDAKIELVAKELGPLPTDTPASLMPTHTYETASKSPDILFAPGGTEGTFAIMEDRATLDYLADTGARSGWITSVCTGALVMGAAGLLKGYQATTHWAALDQLKNFGATPVKERWVIDRNRASGGGVTAGIDFGLAITAEIAGEEAARMAQLAVEYNPHPPYNSGHPDVATPETVTAVLDHFAETTARLATTEKT